VEQTFEPHVEQTFEPHVEQTFEPHVEQTFEPHVEQAFEPHVEQTFEPHVEQTFELTGDTFEPTELVAVARMTSPDAPPAHVRKLLHMIRELSRVETPELDSLEGAALKQLEPDQGAPSYEEGYALACWVRRDILGLADEARVDPEAVLKRWGVLLEYADLGSATIDAVAAWGPRHGPAILVNTNARSRHCGQNARRATLAHEIAHLLVDRAGALPLAEVMGGQVAKPVEQRAGAFAAELLIPRHVAGNAFAGGGDPKGTLQNLIQQYGASQELVAWQARNSDVFLRRDIPDADWYLRDQVSEPARF
jgi:Zn-dependent peptidase ImmA (M78 family)